MWQAQAKENERKTRRKDSEPLQRSSWGYSEELYHCHQELMGRYPMRETVIGALGAFFCASSEPKHSPKVSAHEIRSERHARSGMSERRRKKRNGSIYRSRRCNRYTV